MQTLEQQFTIHFAFPVIFGRNIFRPEDPHLASVLLRGGEKRHKVLCFADAGVLQAYPSLEAQLGRYAAVNGSVMELCGPIVPVPGGEGSKADPAVIDMIISCVEKYHLCRHSFILAIGGGAVLDAVGYGAAISHRGIRLIRMPTTVLAQNDAGVGVKNGVNGRGRKNFIGTFAPPFAVINDFAFLDSLSPRDLRAGMAEAVKVALIRDQRFFATLYERRFDLAAFAGRPLEELIHRCAELHMAHIGSGGDPFELGSARPLDFGHWSAHKLEEMTGGQISHGEAVAVGMALDSLYSCHSGMIAKSELNQIFTLIEDLGLPLYHAALSELDVTGALDDFREHLGGELSITLLTGIGSKKEVDRIDPQLMRRCITELQLRNRSETMTTEQMVRQAPLYGQAS